jgi:hypothetical protein
MHARGGLPRNASDVAGHKTDAALHADEPRAAPRVTGGLRDQLPAIVSTGLNVPRSTL